MLGETRRDSSSLTEYLDRVGYVPELTAPAACASEGAAEYYRTQSHLRQAMSPNSSQTLPQNPFQTQAPSRGAGANVQTKDPSTECKDDDSTTSIPKMVPVKEDFFDVEGGLGSGPPGSRNAIPAQASQTSVLENERTRVPEQLHETEWPQEPQAPTHDRNSQDNLPQAP